MAKNLFQDMVRVKRQRQESVRRTVPVGVPRAEQIKSTHSYTPPTPPAPLERETHRQAPLAGSVYSGERRMAARSINLSEGSKGGNSYMLWVVAITAVLFFLFSLSFLFTNATVTINPKMLELTYDKDMSAVKVASKDDDLPYDLVVISGQIDKLVKNSSIQDVSVPAKGTVVLYNAFSKTNQKILANTRLEGSNGKIYKLDKSVTIPAMKGTTPGSIEATISASLAGEEYNSGPLDFKFPAFKGTSKYSTFYARSKGEISGGAKGQKPILSDNDKATLHGAMVSALRESLIGKVVSQVPSGFLLFESAVTLTTEQETFAPPKVDGSVVVSMKGTLYGLLFNEDKLTQTIAKAAIDDYDGSLVSIPNIKDLTLLLASPRELNEDLNGITFNLSGTPKIVYKIDEKKLTADLLGKPKASFNQILSKYPNIESAKSTISPFWKTSFPDKISKIHLEIDYSK